VKVRRALASELPWMNECYRSIDFRESGDNDFTVIAEIDGERAGIARIVPEGTAGELGGMYVFDRFRGRGVAQALIAFLIDTSDGTLYCLPFERLEPLYAQFGFVRVAGETVPRAISEKHRWCNSHYTEPVLLLVLNR
jgi:N-acetylglutamate synthase-like GNAT family acetyltransferase